MKKSVLRRMLVLPFLILIPFNILLILASVLNLHTGRQELIQASRNYIDLATAQLSRDIAEADAGIWSLADGDSVLFKLQAYPKPSLEDPDFYLDLMTFFREMNKVINSNTNMSAAFLSLSSLKEIWGRGSNVSAIAETLANSDQFFEDTPSFRQLYEKEANPGMLQFYKIADFRIGYYLSFSECLQSLKHNRATPSQVWFGKREKLDGFLREHSDQILITSPVESADLVFVCAYPPDAFQSGISSGIYILLLLSFLSLVASPILFYYYYRQIYRPTSSLRAGIARVQEGDLQYRVSVPETIGFNEFADLAVHFNSMMDEIVRSRLDTYELKLQQQELKLNYYSQQIRPHFILNCLNLIYTNEEENHEYTKEMILHMTRYFRYIVNIRRNDVTLSEEMNFVKTYLNIEKLRLGRYFLHMVSWDHTLDGALIPPLTLSTFVENSIRHALAPDERCCIVVNATRKNDRILIRISDSGDGFPQKVLDGLNQYLLDGTGAAELGTGIINTTERLRLFYDNDISISFFNEGGAVTQINIPVR